MIVGFRAKNHPQQVRARGAQAAADDRGTDPAFVAQLEQRLGGPFTLDVAASPHNAKAPDYYTVDLDGLAWPWPGRVWCNPPYSECGAWMAKAWAEWLAGTPELIAMLLPANRAEQAWWQETIEPYRDRPGSSLRVEFLRGRMRFHRPNAVIGPKGDRPPFGCALLLWTREASS